MADEIRLIDAEKLKRKLLECDENDDDRFPEGYNYAINEIREYIDDMPIVEAEPAKWVSVKDRLPEPNTEVLVYIKYPQPVLSLDTGIKKKANIKKLFFDGEGFVSYDYGKLTHWMPLPEPPESEEDDEE